MARTRSSTQTAAKPKSVKPKDRKPARKPARKAQSPVSPPSSPPAQTAQTAQTPLPAHIQVLAQFAQLRAQLKTSQLVRDVLLQLQFHANAQARLVQGLIPLMDQNIALFELLLPHVQ